MYIFKYFPLIVMKAILTDQFQVNLKKKMGNSGRKKLIVAGVIKIMFRFYSLEARIY